VDTILDASAAQLVRWLPARVAVYRAPGVDEGFQRPARVDVDIMVKYRRRTPNEKNALPGETVCQGTPGPDTEVVGEYPRLTDIPLLIPGPRAAKWRGPLEIGEEGALLVSGRELMRWARGEGQVTPPWLSAKLEGAPTALQSAVFIPGLEVSPGPKGQYTDSHVFGPAQGLSQLELTPQGTWEIRGPEVTAKFVGLALPLAKNAEVIAALTAFAGSLATSTQFTPPQEAAINAALTAALAPLLGTSVFRAE